jgi:hypothetical protein
LEVIYRRRGGFAAVSGLERPVVIDLATPPCRLHRWYVELQHDR